MRTGTTLCQLLQRRLKYHQKPISGYSERGVLWCIDRIKLCRQRNRCCRPGSQLGGVLGLLRQSQPQNPTIIHGVITDNKLILGLKLTEITSRTFSERRPRKKPFFHPSAMPSKMARCMVNLAHAKAESVLLDPFCGTGTSLIEATFVGCRAVGVDAQRRMILGTKKNLAFFSIEAEGLVLADSRKIPLAKVDAIVTDPPYGRSSSTLKSTTKQLVQDVLASAHGLLGAGQRICIAGPRTLNIPQLGAGLGYRHVESHFAYVHQTLTREIAVFEKVKA